MSLDSAPRDGFGSIDLSHIRRLVRHWIAYVGARRLVGGVVSVTLVCLAGWMLVRPAPAPVESAMPRASALGVEVATSTAPAAPATLTVHVAGAVRKPGVYSLAAGSRVVDAVRAAGGASSRADLEGINLAQVIIDTEQVYVPVRRTSAPRVTVAPRLRPVRSRVPTTTVATTPDGGATTPGTPGQARVDLNSATAAQLDALPGVGPATARAIIAHRARKGPFAKVEDLMNVPGIGPAKFAAVRDYISV